MSKRVWLGVSVCSVTPCLPEWAQGLCLVSLHVREAALGEPPLPAAQAALCPSEATT